MAREDFINSLRIADRELRPPQVNSDLGPRYDDRLTAVLHSADLWLTPRSVEGFDPADFADWPAKEQEELANEVAAFRSVADKVPSNKPATKAQSKQARKHLQRSIELVRQHVLDEWLEAQAKMIDEATAAAKTKGWYVEKDEKEVRESLLGKYWVPRLRIKAGDKEVILDPIGRFGSGKQGIVDFVVMPTYETVYLIAYKDGGWQIISPRGTSHRRPFNQTTLVNSIVKLPH